VNDLVKRLRDTRKFAGRVSVLVDVFLEGGSGGGLDLRDGGLVGGRGGGGGDLERLGEGLAGGIDGFGRGDEEGDFTTDPVL
jgi:hypothetical protein